MAFNRYFIITRSYRNRLPASKLRLFAVQASVWVFVILVYVTMYLLANANIGVPHLREFVNGTAAPHVDNSSTCNSTAPPVVTTSSHDLPKEAAVPPIHNSFMVVDIRSGIKCSPHWRLLIHYLIAAFILFYILPLCVVIMSYCMITRIAYKQVRSIRRVTLRSCDSPPPRKKTRLSTNSVAPSEGQDQPRMSTVSGASEMVQNYTRPLLFFHQMLKENSLRRKTKARRRKATIAFIVAISLFVFSWTPYYAYFLVESVSYQVYITSPSGQWEPPFHRGVSVFLTCTVVIGRTWSIIVIAVLNRPYRRTIKQVLRRAARRIVHCCYRISGKTIPEMINGDTVFSVSHFVTSKPTFTTNFNPVNRNNNLENDCYETNYRTSVLSNQLLLPGQPTLRRSRPDPRRVTISENGAVVESRPGNSLGVYDNCEFEIDSQDVFS